MGIASPRFARFGAIVIPVATADRVTDTLLQKGRIPRGYLGVALQLVRLPDQLRESLRHKERTAAIALEVETNGPAQKAGILIRDILLFLDGQPISRPENVQLHLDAGNIASPWTRAGLQNALADSFVDVVGSAPDVHALSEQLVDVEPDVILMEAPTDAHEELLDALVGREITREYPVVLLADQISLTWSSEALRAGVRAVLHKDVSPEQLRATLEAATLGLTVVHPSEVSILLPVSASSAALVAGLPEPLTRREREVLQMLAAGLANKEIAARLSISDHTVKFHVASILGKLGASTRTEAVSMGIRRGLVLL